LSGIIAGPLLPREAREPFVGGRVALLRHDGAAVTESGQAILAPVTNAFDRSALPYADEMRRLERQTGQAEDSDVYSSEEIKKLK
jgi:hypothetical protein